MSNIEGPKFYNPEATTPRENLNSPLELKPSGMPDHIDPLIPLKTPLLSGIVFEDGQQVSQEAKDAIRNEFAQIGETMKNTGTVTLYAVPEEVVPARQAAIDAVLKDDAAKATAAGSSTTK